MSLYHGNYFRELLSKMKHIYIDGARTSVSITLHRTSYMHKNCSRI